MGVCQKNTLMSERDFFQQNWWKCQIYKIGKLVSWLLGSSLKRSHQTLLPCIGRTEGERTLGNTCGWCWSRRPLFCALRNMDSVNATPGLLALLLASCVTPFGFKNLLTSFSSSLIWVLRELMRSSFWQIKNQVFLTWSPRALGVWQEDPLLKMC